MANEIKPTQPQTGRTGEVGRDGTVPDKRQQEQEQEQAGGSKTQINEGGRTNDSHGSKNPKGAVHGLPTEHSVPGSEPHPPKYAAPAQKK